jgi:hypothetical protein
VRAFVAFLAFVPAVLLVAPGPATAWKPYTHNYSADQARLDAVAGGDVTIEGRTYPVRPEVVAALRDWPQFYNAGVIGPDGFPDLTYGQSVIHPVRTGEWLRHIYDRAWAAQSDPTYSPAEKSQILAFAYGFLTHAAGDMWAHTLVNDFSDPSRLQGVFPAVGDILTSLPMAGIAARHIIVEGYIGDATPGFDANPERSPAPLGDVSDDSTPGFAYDVPHRFIYETLIRPSAPTPVPALRGSYMGARGPLIGIFLELRGGLQDFVNYDPPSLQDSINEFDDTIEALMIAQCSCNFGVNVVGCSNACCIVIGCSDVCDVGNDLIFCGPALLVLGITAVVESLEAFLAIVADTAVDLAFLVLDSYTSAWIDDIDSGLRDWSRLGLASTRGLFDAQARRDLQNDECAHWGSENGQLRADCEAQIGTLAVVLHEVDPFINDHLLSMIGLPDFVGDVRRIVGEIQDFFEDLLFSLLMPLNPVLEPLADIKHYLEDLIADTITSVIGVDLEALGNFLKEPHRFICLENTPFTFPPPIGPVTLPLFPAGQHARLDGILQIPPGHHVPDVGLPEDCGRLQDDTVVDPAVFATLRNTVTMSKLLLLDGPQVNQVLGDILGRTIETYGPGDDIMTKTLDGSPEWLRLIDGDHSWRQDGAPVFGARAEEITAGTGQFPLWESCVLRPAFRTLFRDWENGAESFPDLGDAESADPANDPSAPTSTLTQTGAFYDDGLHKFVGADNVFTHTAHDGPPGKAFPDDQLELQHRTYAAPGPPGPFVTTGQPAAFSLAGADGSWFIDVRSGDHCHTISETDARPPETTQTLEFVLDTAAPVTTGNDPPFGQVFGTDDVSAVSYSLSDGPLGSGIASSSSTLDGWLTETGVTPVANGAVLDMYLLYPGTRTVTVSATDHLGQASVSTHTFEIQPTPESMLNNLARAAGAGLIRNQGLTNALRSKLEAAAAAAARGQCTTAQNVLNAFLHHMEAQRGQGVDAETADRFIAYARDLLLSGDALCGPTAGRAPLGVGGN